MSEQSKNEEIAKQLQELRDRLEERGILQKGKEHINHPDIKPDAVPVEGLRDLMRIPADEFSKVMEEKADQASRKGDYDLANFYLEKVDGPKLGKDMSDSDREASARLAEEEGKTELARLIRGQATPQQLGEEAVHRALVEHAQSLGGVVVEERPDPSFDEGTRKDKYDPPFQSTSHNMTADRQMPSAEFTRMGEILERIYERMETIEEEVMFTSSANRFAHLRSGVDQTDGAYIPRLPPAPDWNTLETYVEPLLRDIVDHVYGAPILKERSRLAGLLPMDILKGVDVVADELLRIVGERGRKYGEESILAMGEAGMISMIMAKVMRLMWSHRGGLVFESRRDSYIDLAGYCLLTVALDEFIQEKSGKEEGTNVEDGTVG